MTTCTYIPQWNETTKISKVVLLIANAITNAITAAKLASSEIQKWMLAAVQETHRNHCLQDAQTIACLQPA